MAPFRLRSRLERWNCVASEPWSSTRRVAWDGKGPALFGRSKIAGTRSAPGKGARPPVGQVVMLEGHQGATATTTSALSMLMAFPLPNGASLWMGRGGAFFVKLWRAPICIIFKGTRTGGRPFAAVKQSVFKGFQDSPPTQLPRPPSQSWKRGQTGLPGLPAWGGGPSAKGFLGPLLTPSTPRSVLQNRTDFYFRSR